MDPKDYIETGILEMYVFNMLTAEEAAGVEQMMAQHEEIRNEVSDIQRSLERYAAENAISPPLYLKEEIGQVISNLEKERKMDLNDLPVINKFSDHTNWQRLVSGMIPKRIDDGRYVQLLRATEKISQALVVSETDFEEEDHNDLYESFLILDGKCECTVGDTVTCMGAGDYMEIPLYTMHKVKMLTPYVTAILQRVAIS